MKNGKRKRRERERERERERKRERERLNNKKTWHFVITVFQKNGENHSEEVIDKNNGVIISPFTCIIALTGNLLLWVCKLAACWAWPELCSSPYKGGILYSGAKGCPAALRTCPSSATLVLSGPEIVRNDGRSATDCSRCSSCWTSWFFWLFDTGFGGGTGL